MRGPSTPEERVGRFFSVARARHEIYLRRAAGEPPPWTRDPILATFRFTNVFRELDRTTVALRSMTNVMRGDPHVLLLVVALRWFNRTQTWDRLLHLVEGDLEQLVQHLAAAGGRRALQEHLCALPPPHVTGAYIVKTPQGMDKLAGVWYCIEQFATAQIPFMNTPVVSWRGAAELMLMCRGAIGLEDVWRWLLPQDHMGPFMAYEVVSDLRHTALLDQAPDIMTWANAGPGAMRGLNRVHDRDLYHARRSHDWAGEMRELLQRSCDPMYWPAPSDVWPAWEMREVEHWLCEWDKYERVRRGEGRPRGTYP